MTKPLVTVVCLCYNHERFIREAVESVIKQSYANIQIIIVDDASTDGSIEIIRQLTKDHRQIEPLFLAKNLGNCAAFNRALAMIRGEYFVDFATDDVMMPERIAHQVEHFQSLDQSYGVVFTDAEYIDENGNFIRDHFGYLSRKGQVKTVPQGDVYQKLLTTYFVPSPTMLVRTQVIKSLGGYDERLSYEDFDFWIRSSRHYKYSFLNEKLTRIRKTMRSMSVGWYRQGDKQLHSTYLVCEKAFELNRSEQDHNALAIRLHYELRQSVFSDNIDEAKLFFDLLSRMGRVTAHDRLMMILARIPVKLAALRRAYHRWRYEMH